MKTLFFTCKAVAVLTTAFVCSSAGAFVVCTVFTWLAHAFGFPQYHISPADYTGIAIVGGIVALVGTLLYAAADSY